MTRFLRVKSKVFKDVVNGVDMLIVEEPVEPYNRGDVLILMEKKKGIDTGRKWGKRISSCTKIMIKSNQNMKVVNLRLEPLNWV